MRRIAIIAALVGLALATAIVGYVGFGQVFAALAKVGWLGFIVLTLWSALIFALLASAWFTLAPGESAPRWRTYLVSRMVRDAASELLPFSLLGGFVIGARAAIVLGVSGAVATATTVVDITAEFIAQLGFAALGLALLAARAGPGHAGAASLLWSGPLGLAVSVGAAGLFILLQRRGSHLIETVAAHFAPGAHVQIGAVTQTLREIYRRPGRIVLAVGFHFAAWVGGAAGVWLALRVSGTEISLSGVVAIESLLYALRSVAFFAPMAIGVQEAGYAVIGPLFGLSPEMSLALSLLKRARDLVIGVPVLALWQALEGKRLLAPAEGD